MKTKKIISLLSLILFMTLSYVGLTIKTQAAESKDVVVEGGYRFLLYYTQAIQSYAVDGNDIYIQQAYSENEFDEFDDYKTGRVENLVLISRCQYSAEYDAYKPVDHMVIRGAGHGQTLEVYNYNGNIFQTGLDRLTIKNKHRSCIVYKIFKNKLQNHDSDPKPVIITK